MAKNDDNDEDDGDDNDVVKEQVTVGWIVSTYVLCKCANTVAKQGDSVLMVLTASCFAGFKLKKEHFFFSFFFKGSSYFFFIISFRNVTKLYKN